MISCPKLKAVNSLLEHTSEDPCSIDVYPKVAFDTLPTKIASNIDYHLEILPHFKLLVILNLVFGMHR